jgi:hypothetical protein
MRRAALDSFLLALAALSAAACGDSPLEPAGDATPMPELAVPEPEFDIPAPPPDTTRWADGYLVATSQTAASYAPDPNHAYNRSGGAITITKVPGYTGRYVAMFRGLSALLGSKNAVQVGGFGLDASFCKPMTGSLIQDKVEVRCFQTATGNAADAQFSLVVLRKSTTRAAAYAHQPTATNYAPQAAGSWNPAGTTTVVRYGLGKYQVIFNNLGTRTTTNGGHVQVHAVGSGKAQCRAEWEWGGSPNLAVHAACYLPNGQPVDAKFTVLFTLPAAHLAYAWSTDPLANWPPAPFYSTAGVKSAVSVQRYGTGLYTVQWSDSDSWILQGGVPLVTPQGEYESGHCKISGMGSVGVTVRCFATNGTLADSRFAVLLGS